jgi:hypothetical protein
MRDSFKSYENSRLARCRFWGQAYHGLSIWRFVCSGNLGPVHTARQQSCGAEEWVHLIMFCIRIGSMGKARIDKHRPYLAERISILALYGFSNPSRFVFDF